MSETLLLIICIAIYLVVGFPIIRAAVRNILHGDVFDENFLMCVASIGSFIMGEYEDSIIVMLLYRIGEFLQDRAVDKSRRAITDLMDIRPDYANIEKDGEYVQVSPETLAVGDIIMIKPGERVPADGVVIEGSSRVDTAAITGESLPADITVHSEVYSGTINLDGMIRVRVSAAAESSTAARILELVEDAAASRAKSEKFITKFARVYTPAVCACALVLGIVPPLIVGNWHDWIYRALTFLIISCPCALVISIPLGFFAGIGGASHKGILIKGGNYLEALSKADTVAFDKTGTLTKGVFKVVAIHPHDFPERKLLELAAYSESFSNHPISRSLADEYGKHIDKARVKDFKEVIGEGVEASVSGIRVAAGNYRLMETLGIEYHECEVPGTTVHVAVDGVYAGHITISDVIKDDSVEALQKLKALGIRRNIMFTGDKESVAKNVASELGIDQYKAEMLPLDKLDEAKKIKAELPEKSRFAFVGDGINDAPVLTLADVGIAMGGMGSAAAVEAADIVLMNDRPSDVAEAVRISRKTMRIVYQNIYFSIGIKLLVLLLTAVGYSGMWLAIFADVGVCMLAILNSMRALK